MHPENTSTPGIHPMTPVLLEGEWFHHAASTPELIRMGRPARDPLPGGDMYCPIEVWNRDSRRFEWQIAVFGINALQAVENAYGYLRLRWPIMPDGS